MLSESIEKALSLVSDLVADLEAAALSGQEAAVLAASFSRLARLAEAGTALCARRVSEVGYFERLGHASPESWLADVAGRPRRAARSLLETAGTLGGLPGLESALRAGELSGEQAAEVARGATAEPSLLEGLLETARGGSLPELRAEADRAEAAARSREADEARHARVRARRHLRMWNDPDGSLQGRFCLPPEEGAVLLAALEAEANRRFDEARRAGAHEGREAYLADALCGLGGGASAGRPGGRLEASVLFHVSLEALVRGSLLPGEECSLSSGAHVPLSVVEGYLARSRLRLVVVGGTDVCSVFTLRRAIPAAVETALVARDRSCVVPGCSSTFRLEIDHLVPFSEGGPTRLSNLARLCRAHHAMKSEKGWRLEGGPGHWCWLPPLSPPPAGAGSGSTGARRRGRPPARPPHRGRSPDTEVRPPQDLRRADPEGAEAPGRRPHPPDDLRRADPDELARGAGPSPEQGRLLLE